MLCPREAVKTGCPRVGHRAGSDPCQRAGQHRLPEDPRSIFVSTQSRFDVLRVELTRPRQASSPKARCSSPTKTGCPSGRTISFSGLAYQPINQPSCRHSRPRLCNPENVRSTTASKPMPSFVAGRVLTNTTFPDAGKRSTPRKNHDNSTRSRPEKTQSPRF